jgi:hypothetical protein
MNANRCADDLPHALTASMTEQVSAAAIFEVTSFFS